MKTEHKIKVTLTSAELASIIRIKYAFPADSIVDVVIDDSTELTEIKGRWYFRDDWFFIDEAWRHSVCPTDHSVDIRIEIVFNDGHTDDGKISDWKSSWNQDSSTRIVKFRII